EPAHVMLFVRGVRRVVGHGAKRRGSLQWFGRIDGKPVRAGTYPLAVVAVDLAGNRSRPVSAGSVVVHYVELRPTTATVRAKSSFRTAVVTSSASYRWRFAGGSGTARAKALVLRAPKRPGRYVLFVTANGHGAREIVHVTKAKKPAAKHRSAQP